MSILSEVEALARDLGCTKPHKRGNVRLAEALESPTPEPSKDFGASLKASVEQLPRVRRSTSWTGNEMGERVLIDPTNVNLADLEPDVPARPAKAQKPAGPGAWFICGVGYGVAVGIVVMWAMSATLRAMF